MGGRHHFNAMGFEMRILSVMHRLCHGEHLVLDSGRGGGEVHGSKCLILILNRTSGSHVQCNDTARTVTYVMALAVLSDKDSVI